MSRHAISELWFTASEYAAMRLSGRGTSERAWQLKAERNDWPSRKRIGRGGGREFPVSCLPPADQAQVALYIERQNRSGEVPDLDPAPPRSDEAWARFDALPEKAKAKAREALALIQTAERLIAAGGQRRKSVYEVAAAGGVDPATLYRKFQAVRDVPAADRLPALAPKHRGREKAAECSPEAWEFFKADYLRPAMPAADACYERLLRVADERGWTVPSIGTLRRRIAGIPEPLLVLARKGPEALKRAYPAQERDRSHFTALEAVNVDGHKFDVFVEIVDPDTGAKRTVRPVLVAWQDLYSGKILAWRLGETECAELVRLSIADLVGDWGIPHDTYMDNGRGFASKWITGRMPNRYRFKVRDEDPSGVLTDLGVAVHWTHPYSGQSKPIERAFRDLCEYIARHPRCDGAYTGNSPDRKPADYGRRAVPWHVFEQLVDEEIGHHNKRAGRRSLVCAGSSSFDDVFLESYALQPIRKATEAQLRSMLLAGEGVTAHREDCSLRLHGNRYWSEALVNAGIGGRKVIVRFDPQRLAQPVHVYTIDGRYVATAQRIEKAGFDDVEAARKHEKQRRRWMKAKKEQLAAENTMSAMEAAEMLPKSPASGADAEPAVVRPIFERPSGTSTAAAPADDAEHIVIDQREEFARRLRTGMAAEKRLRGR